MTRKTYRLTTTARAQLEKAVRETKQTWGMDQARKYSAAFLEGLQHLAENHRQFNAPHRKALAEGTAFSVSLIEHRYVAFREVDKETIVVAGIFHESMDIPARLRELQGLTLHEIDILKREIVRASGRKHKMN